MVDRMDNEIAGAPNGSDAGISKVHLNQTHWFVLGILPFLNLRKNWPFVMKEFWLYNWASDTSEPVWTATLGAENSQFLSCQWTQ